MSATTVRPAIVPALGTSPSCRRARSTPRASTRRTIVRANGDVPNGSGASGRLGGGTDDNGRMHVPTDAFGGMSPEHKAAAALKNLFTMVAVRVVLAQEQGYDNEGGGMTETAMDCGCRRQPLARREQVAGGADGIRTTTCV